MPTNTPARRVAYVMSRFPKLSETFILYEILELERLGMRVEIFPLVRQREAAIHPEAAEPAARAHYIALLSLPVLAAQLYWLLRAPGAYMRAWAKAIAGNARSPKFLARALMVVPIAAYQARRMEQLGVQHVHAHWATHPALAAFVIAELSGLPYSFTAHAHDIYVERAMLGAKIERAAFVVTISDYNRRLLGELYGAQAAAKTVVLHCGVDAEVFQPRAATAGGEPFTIVSVGRLEEKKGQLYLIEACALLKARGVQVRCLVIGEGDDRPVLERRIAELGVGELVELLGGQPRAAVSKLLASADAFVMPSVRDSSGDQEGIPVALMEAMAVELPVVASALSGIPELVEDGVNGLLAPQRDPAALADAIARLIDDRALGERLGAAARLTVLRDFNLATNTAGLFRLLDQDWNGRTLPRALIREVTRR